MKTSFRNSLRKLGSKAKKCMSFSQTTEKISPYPKLDDNEQTDDIAKYEYDVAPDNSTFADSDESTQQEDEEQLKPEEEQHQPVVQSTVQPRRNSTGSKTTEIPAVSFEDTNKAVPPPPEESNSPRNSPRWRHAISSAKKAQNKTYRRPRRASMTDATTSSVSFADTPAEHTDESQTATDEQQQRPVYRSAMKKSNGRARRRASMTDAGECSISFAANDHVHEVAKVSSLTKNPERLWFQEDEYHRIHQRINLVVKVAGTSEEHKKVCTRGLETLMKGPSPEKHDAMVSVLYEQDMQRYEGKKDSVGMAMAYEAMSRDSQLEARQRGMEDAKAIENYLKSTRKMMRRMSC